MPHNPQLRASDDDRDRAAALLREHHAAGRLTVDEFSERLDAAYQARTLGDIDELLADLPSIDLYHLPDESMRRMAHASAPSPAARDGADGRLSPAWRGAWASWASVSMLLFVIWLITAISSHSASGLWFLWIAGPWGAILLGRWLFGTHPQGPPGPRPDERMQRHDEHMQRRIEHIERHRERIERHRDRSHPPAGDDRHGSPEAPGPQPPGPREF